MFKRGLDGMKGTPKTQRNSDNVFDFWLDYNERADLIFLDSLENAPFEVVHPVFYDKKQHLVLCNKAGGNECLFCDYFDTLSDRKGIPYAREMAFLTVLDLRPYEKDDGTVIPVTKKLFKANKRVVDQLRREMDDAGADDLYGSLWRISRGPDAMPKPAAVGDKFRYERKTDLEALLEKHNLDESMLAPLDAKVLYSMLVTEPEAIRQVFDRWLQLSNPGQTGGSRKETGFSGARLNV